MEDKNPNIAQFCEALNMEMIKAAAKEIYKLYIVAVGVNEDGYREVIGAAEGMKEDKAGWPAFFQWLKSRGLNGVHLVVSDECLGLPDTAAEVFPEV